MRQSRLISLMEAAANVVVGYGVAVLTQLAVFPWFGLPARVTDALGIGAVMTGVSVVRTFALRRLFEALRARGGDPAVASIVHLGKMCAIGLRRRDELMDAFESVVSEILWRDGYWVQSSFKVELTKEEKAAIDRPTSPRWELDIVGYSGRRNEIIVVECKSYLDSTGVAFRAFDGTDKSFANRFKLFNDPTLRDVVFERLKSQLFEAGLVSANPSVRLALVCGKIVREQDRQLLRAHFEKNAWLLWDDEWLKERLRSMSRGGYENSPVAVVSKLLLRG